MSWLASRYTQSLNYDKSRDGPIFRGRYNSILIENEEHLLECIRYIHLNPVLAQIVTDPADWKWSSAPEYLGTLQKPKWLCTSTILEMFPSDSYRQYLEDGKNIGLMQKYERVYGVRPCGSDPT